MLTLELQLTGVFDDDHPFAVGNERGQGVEQAGLARPRPPGDDHIALALHKRPQCVGRIRGQGAKADQLFDCQGLLGETADRDVDPIARGWGQDGFNAGPVGQAGFQDRRVTIDMHALKLRDR